MQTLTNWKESWQKLPGKTKKAAGILAGGTILLALIALLALNLGKDTSYTTLFTGMSQDEAQEVAALLQDEGVDYRYDTEKGSIRVPQEQADQLRANLLSQGYPKSGFTYDMYLDNAGLMATESDKEQVTLYELQDRLGAQIRLFDGVQDAKVTIAQGSESRYALSNEPQMTASASVVITMDRGATLTADKANAVKNLISRAVRGMEFTNVSVFDAATMMEVGTDPGDESSSGNAQDLTSLTTMVENSIAGNIRRVLEQLYGQGNVAVSVKGTLNMERVIQENTQYTTPDKIDNQDKTGLLQYEDLSGENTTAQQQGAGGVAGADANADVPRYTNETGAAADTQTYANGSASREWLYNMMKEQRMVDPGVLEDTTVGVVINTDDTTTVAQNDLIRLVANSAGIPVDQAADKVTVVRAPSPAAGQNAVNAANTSGNQTSQLPMGLSLPALAVLGGAGLLALLLVILLMIQRNRHRAEMRMMEEELAAAQDADTLEDGSEDGDAGRKNPEEADGEEMAAQAQGEEKDEAARMFDEEEEDQKKNEEIINLRMRHNLRLKQNIGEFVDQNPQIAAKLIQSWLRKEDKG